MVPEVGERLNQLALSDRKKSTPLLSDVSRATVVDVGAVAPSCAVKNASACPNSNTGIELLTVKAVDNSSVLPLS